MQQEQGYRRSPSSFPCGFEGDSAGRRSKGTGITWGPSTSWEIPPPVVSSLAWGKDWALSLVALCSIEMMIHWSCNPVCGWGSSCLASHLVLGQVLVSFKAVVAIGDLVTAFVFSAYGLGKLPEFALQGHVLWPNNVFLVTTFRSPV